MANSKPGTYDESSIRVLKGLEPVRLRPGQFTRTDTPLHIVQEAIDNAVDEAIGGHAKLLAVTLHADGSASVVDDGRGIPVGPHPIEKTPVVEAIFTILYSGGKFDKTSGAAAYTYAGGLHGVGVSVTNALSTRLECEVKREGKLHRIVFAGGDVAEKLTVKGKATGTGTAVRIWPDPKYFETPVVPQDELAQLLRTKAVLLPGLKVTLTVETPAGGETREWQYREGLAGYLAELAQDEPPLVPVFAGKNHATESDETFAEGEGVEWAFSWYETAKGDGAALRQPHPDAAGRHPRLGAAQRRVRRGHRVHRPPQPAAQGAEAHAGRRLPQPALRGLGADAGPAVRGADQGQAHQPRRRAPGRADDPRSAGDLAQPARRRRQGDRRSRDPPGAGAHPRGEDGRAQAFVERGDAARQARRLRVERPRRVRALPGRGR